MKTLVFRVNCCVIPTGLQGIAMIEATEKQRILTCRLVALLLICGLIPLLIGGFFRLFFPDLDKAAVNILLVFLLSYCLVTPVYAWDVGKRYAQKRLHDP